MAKITTKYRIGEKVTHFSGQEGMVTAIFIRGRNKSYEFSHIDSEGKLSSATVEQCEISCDGRDKIGFR